MRESVSLREPTAELVEAPAVFARVLCAVDGSPAGVEAARQLAQLRDPDGAARVVSIAETALAAWAGFLAEQAAGELEAGARSAVEVAARQLPGADTCVRQGHPVPRLLREITRYRATLVAVGTHGRGRAAAIALETVGSTLLHEAPCSVLLTRPARTPEPPRTIVVGVDGSDASLRAHAAASALARRLGARLETVAAVGGHGVSSAVAALPDVRYEYAEAVPALVAASLDADLVVVGSRGLHGLQALGSVSERVAHRARCSVLVVR